jgi:hypothetical protein
MIGPASAHAQDEFRYRFAAGLFQQSTAGVADEGWTIGVHRSVTLGAFTALEFGIDWARVSAPASVGHCEVISNGLCVGEGGPRLALAPQVGFRVQAVSARLPRPFLSLGVCRVLSLDDPTSSARPALTAPQVQVGLMGPRGTWAGDLRLRGPRHWQGNVYRQVALHIALLR